MKIQSRTVFGVHPLRPTQKWVVRIETSIALTKFIYMVDGLDTLILHVESGPITEGAQNEMAALLIERMLQQEELVRGISTHQAHKVIDNLVNSGVSFMMQSRTGRMALRLFRSR